MVERTWEPGRIQECVFQSLVDVRCSVIVSDRLFISENVPQLRYRNPAIPISLQRKKVDESEVVVCFGET